MIERTTLGLGLLLLLASSAMAEAQLRYDYIPTTISPEARQALTEIYAAKAYARIFPEADDLDGWRKTHAGGEEGKVEVSKKAVADNKVTVTESKMGGVRCWTSDLSIGRRTARCWSTPMVAPTPCSARAAPSAVPLQ